ncbi:helix-turn-helix domain-containing protein [Gordonia sp. ABSL11-1]|uniref:ArsR/SmtB family transcription factor n=1 Tax=Gordonia sp. ABSL11-1 TaxID=3053924 RepID=UPI0025723B66|nr:helix-turn-helix domain-containing protein [Gordonia sp. ABSL11-1]MDL9944646.1 helix-turn-helix domain-containing protein [Gordonia sp. ABSL11-1]
MSDAESRIRDLTARVGHLEHVVGVAGHADDAGPRDSPTAADDGVESHRAGTIGYSGTVDLGGPVRWDIRYDTESTIGLPAETLAAVFAALGHPVRLSVVRFLLRGAASVSELQETGEFGTSGQLYHHLKTLTAASIVTKSGRNEFVVAPTHVVPILVALLAAGDISGSL